MRLLFLIFLLVSFSLIYPQDADWTNVSSPYGLIYTFVTVENGSRILMGTTRGLWISDASFSGWMPSDNGLANKDINVLSKMNGLIFCGTGKGFYKSSDEGKVWSRCPLPDSNYSSIITYDNKLLFAKACPGPLFVSSDSGNSWKKIMLGGTEREIKNIIWQHNVVSDSAGNLYVAADSADFYYSTNGGADWQRQYMPVKSGGVGNIFIINSRIIFRTGDLKTFYTGKPGEKWTEMKTPGSGFKGLYGSPSGSLLLVTDFHNKFESFDNGTTWQPVITQIEIKKWERLANGDFIATGFNDYSGSMMMLSTNGGLNWTSLVSSFVGGSFICSDNNNYLYASGESSGVFRSGDSGQTWQPVLSKDDIKYITFAGDDLIVMASYYGAYLLTDNCKTIKNANENGLEDSNITCLTSTKAGVIFVGSYTETINTQDPKGLNNSEYRGGGLWRSTDSGNSWSRIFPDQSVKTQDNGKTWLRYDKYSGVYRKISHPDLTVESMGIDPEGALLVELRQGLFKSTDDGETWTKIQSKDYGKRERTKIVKTSAGEIFTGQGLMLEGISRSTDNGKSFNDVVNGLPAADKNDLIALPGGDVLCTTNDGIYYLPFKGNTWSCVAFRGERVGKILSYGDYIYASVEYDIREREPGIYRIPLKELKEKFPWEINKEEVWREIRTPSKGEIQCLEIDESGNYWVVDDNRNLYHSANEGKTWETMSSPSDFVNDLKVESENNNIWIAAFKGLFRSTSSGKEWEKIELPSVNKEPYNVISAASVYFDKNGNIYVGGKDGLSYYTGYLYAGNKEGSEWQLIKKDFHGVPTAIFRSKSDKLFCSVRGSGLLYSTDNGNEWSECNKELLRDSVIYICNFSAEAGSSVSSVNVLEDGTMYVVRGNNSIAKTSDEGGSWTHLHTPGSYALSIYVNPQNIIYASTVWGVFKSSDEGKTWTSFSAGLLSSSIRTLKRDPNGFLVAVAKDGRIYKTIEKVD